MINVASFDRGAGVPDVTGLCGTKSDCTCGRVHTCEIESVIIRHGALNELPALCRDYKNILVVSDGNTRRVCGERVVELLGDRVAGELTYPGEGLVIPNEDAVALLDSHVTDGIDLIVGVGSGVINDLCKYVSHAHSLPYYIVATAPSMDGYASKGAAMLFDGMKITATASVPRAIIADTEVICGAPLDMLRAGYGDIIGKFSCLNDWRLSHEIFGEELCEYIYSLTYDTAMAVAGLGEAIAARDEAAVAELMRALVVVGIAMAYMGNSRPASGSEHHLSHYFEVTGLLRDEPYFAHGIDVAYSTYVTAGLREELVSIDTPSFVPFDEVTWEREIRRVYASRRGSHTADEIIALQKRLGWILRDSKSLYRDKWARIREVLADSPTRDEVLGMLASVGLDIREFERLYSEEKRRDAVSYAKDLKDRYTVLWLYGATVR